MQLTGVPQVVAPLATGHPLGLPGAPVRTAEETKVQPVREQSTTDTDHAADHGSEGQPPAGFWRSLTGMPDPANHVAPPSIMQIRISALLEEQAEALLQELRDKAMARMAATETERPATERPATELLETAPPEAPVPDAAPETSMPNVSAQDRGQKPAPETLPDLPPGLVPEARGAGSRGLDLARGETDQREPGRAAQEAPARPRRAPLRRTGQQALPQMPELPVIATPAPSTAETRSTAARPEAPTTGTPARSEPEAGQPRPAARAGTGNTLGTTPPAALAERAFGADSAPRALPPRGRDAG